MRHLSRNKKQPNTNRKFRAYFTVPINASRTRVRKVLDNGTRRFESSSDHYLLVLWAVASDRATLGVRPPFDQLKLFASAILLAIGLVAFFMLLNHSRIQFGARGSKRAAEGLQTYANLASASLYRFLCRCLPLFRNLAVADQEVSARAYVVGLKVLTRR